ncbi:hypothetical protein [Kitasatospora sp. NPDC091207]|uniref:hypothetical protein n=1 Tax=Kitasatospora sp. NPDC091207 TaxID=3364083 RepID=UPI0037F80ADD
MITPTAEASETSDDPPFDWGRDLSWHLAETEGTEGTENSGTACARVPSEPAERSADRADADTARTTLPAEPWAVERTVGQLPVGVGNRREAVRVPRHAPAAEQVPGSMATVGTKDGPRHRATELVRDEQVRELSARADQLAPAPTHWTYAGTRRREGRAAESVRPLDQTQSRTPDIPDSDHTDHSHVSHHDPAGRARLRTATDAPRLHSGHTEGVGAPITEARRAPDLAGGSGQGTFLLLLPFLRVRPCRAEGDHDRAPSSVDGARIKDLLTLHDRWCAQLSYGCRLPALDAKKERGRTRPRAAEAKDAGHLDLVTGARKTSASGLKPA